MQIYPSDPITQISKFSAGQAEMGSGGVRPIKE